MTAFVTNADQERVDGVRNFALLHFALSLECAAFYAGDNHSLSVWLAVQAAGQDPSTCGGFYV